MLVLLLFVGMATQVEARRIYLMLEGKVQASMDLPAGFDCDNFRSSPGYAEFLFNNEVDQYSGHTIWCMPNIAPPQPDNDPRDAVIINGVKVPIKDKGNGTKPDRDPSQALFALWGEQGKYKMIQVGANSAFDKLAASHESLIAENSSAVIFRFYPVNDDGKTVTINGAKVGFSSHEVYIEGEVAEAAGGVACSCQASNGAVFFKFCKSGTCKTCCGKAQVFTGDTIPVVKY